MDSLRKYLAEIIGTFVLVFFGCGTAIVTGCSLERPAAYLLTALAFGLVIVAMAYSIGNISGCHINPAVSLAMFVNKKMSLQDMLLYWCSQLVGACGAVRAAAFNRVAGVLDVYEIDALDDASVDHVEAWHDCKFTIHVGPFFFSGRRKYTKMQAMRQTVLLLANP